MYSADTKGKGSTALSEPTGFYGDAAELLSRELDVSESVLSKLPAIKPHDSVEGVDDKFSAVRKRFDLLRVGRSVNKLGSKKVALQFPDHLLQVSDMISQCLSDICPTTEFYILADTSYGSCCNDAVAASHADGDCLVHFGHSCLSVIDELPIIYSFDTLALDIQECAQEVQDLDIASSRILVLSELGYSHCLESLQKELSLKLNETQIVVGLIPDTQNVEYSSTDLSLLESERLQGKFSRICGRYFPLSEDSHTSILYIGSETIELTNLLMTKETNSKVYRFDPASKKAFEDEQTNNRRLMRRYHLVQKAKDASVFGIVVGTLGVGNYLPMIQHVRDLIEANGGKAYTFVMGKLNVAKLANFLEIDMYVLVACPENSLIDSKEFFRPIITPFELVLAFNPDSQWTGKYVTEFETLLKDAPAVPQEDNVPHYSLVTGKLVNSRRYRHTSTVELEMEAEGTLLKRDQPSEVARALGSAAGEYLVSRSFQGLEPSLGQSDVHLAEEGREGIARGYKNEKEL